MMTYGKYPVGPKTLKRASQTEAGKLAALLAEVIYTADECEVMVKTHGDTFNGKARRYVCEDKVFLGSNNLPKSVPACESKDYLYFETKRLMLAIQDFLEEVSIREVCE